MSRMFAGIQPAEERFRNHRAVTASVLAHLGLLAAVLLHRPTPIELIPLSLANGIGTQSYRVIYAPPDGKDSRPDEKITLAHSARAARRRPKPSSLKPPSEHREVPPDAL